MKQPSRWLLAAALATSLAALATPALAVPLVLPASYAALSGPVIHFEDVGGDADGLVDGLVQRSGVTFGERFAGQELSVTKAPRPGVVAQDAFDDLSFGSPTAGLTLLAGAAGHNLGLYDYGDAHGQALVGMGPDMADGADPWGFGAISGRFDTLQSGLGFYLRDTDGGQAWLRLYREDGSLIEALTLDLLQDGYFAFSRVGGVADIAGFSLFNRDAYYGIALDELKLGGAAVAAVPAPASASLAGLGLMLLWWRRRER